MFANSSSPKVSTDLAIASRIWHAVLEAIQPARPAPIGALNPNAAFELSMVRADVRPQAAALSRTGPSKPDTPGS